VQEFSGAPKESFLKVSCVEGDIEKEGLGLSREHREILIRSHISVIFHIAASVRLRDPLDLAMKTNTFPVIDMLRLCEELPEVKVKKARSVDAPNL
jgi:fatty acyl-CoA reductase